MKRTLLAAALLSLAFTVPALAAEGDNPPTATGQTFEQKQSNILNMMDERIAGLQEGKTCVQAATNDSDLKACREKHRSEMRAKLGGKKHQQGMNDCSQCGMGETQ